MVQISRILTKLYPKFAMMEDTNSGATLKLKLWSNGFQKIVTILLTITYLNLYSIANLYANVEKSLKSQVVASQTEGRDLDTASRYKELYSVMGQSSSDDDADDIISEKKEVNAVKQNTQISSASSSLDD